MRYTKEYITGTIAKTINNMSMHKLLDFILSFLFPLTEAEQLLRNQINSITAESLLAMAPVSAPLPKEMFSVLNYQNPLVKEIIHRLKYKGERRFSTLLANTLYPNLIEELSDKKLFDNFTDPVLIPIPLSKKRMRERGFNQSELVARELTLLDGGKNFTIDSSILHRVKDSEHQARIKDRVTRFKNSKQAFSVFEKTKVQGRNVILLDDVITTGATILSARDELLKAGAKQVYMISVAH